MKTSKLTVLAATLALCALALTGCNKAATNTNNANSTANSNATANSNKPPVAADASATGDYSTPTAAFKTFYEAAKKNDIEGMKRSMTKKTMAVMEKAAAEEKKSVDEAFKEMNKDAPSSVPEIRNEKIDGDKATVEIKDDKMKDWSTVPFVKENGQWKIALADAMAGAMDKMESMDSEKK